MRLFVAVVPPDDVLDALRALRRPPVAGIRWTTRNQWHVTLRFLGEVDGSLVGPVAEALDGASLGGAVAVELGPAVRALGDRVVCVPAAGLDEVAAGVVRATAGFGIEPGRRKFRGHLTLARVSRGRASRVTGEPFSASFVASEVVLMRSSPHPTGASYSVVHRRELSG